MNREVTNSNHILLISYTFPPYPGIGGRRWAKFSKHLSRLGYTIHVIHANNPFKEESLWLDDVRNDPNIHMYELNSSYPTVLLTQPKTIYDKINYKLSLLKVKFLTKGTPYDRAVFWKKSMLALCEQLIKTNGIKNVLVSCAPFSCAYYALQLKENFNNLNLITDLRDPWTWGKGYGFSFLSKKRLLFEKQMEKEVIEKTNYVLVPSIEMKYHIGLAYPKFSDKIVEFPHAFDDEEITIKEKEKSDKVRLMFYGTIYNNLDLAFENISEAIVKSSSTITLDIYSPTNSYENLFEQKKLLNNTVIYYKPMLPKLLFEKMSNYDYVLIVQPDYAKDFITTKIYEIIYSITPIILVSNEGKLSDFISSNGLGLWFTPNQLIEGFRTLGNINPEIFKTKQFPIENYSFKFIISNLVNYFK